MADHEEGGRWLIMRRIEGTHPEGCKLQACSASTPLSFHRMLVGTKAEGRGEARQVDRDEAQDLADRNGMLHFETSAMVTTT